MDSPRRLTKCNHYLCFMSHILTYIPHVSWKRLVSIFVLCFIGIQCCCYLPTVFRRAWFTRWQRQAIILYTVSNSSIQLTSKRKWFLRFYIISRILLIFSHMICILCCGDLPLSFITTCSWNSYIMPHIVAQFALDMPVYSCRRFNRLF